MKKYKPIELVQTIQQIFKSLNVKPIALSVTIFHIFREIDKNLKNYEKCEQKTNLDKRWKKAKLKKLTRHSTLSKLSDDITQYSVP